MKSVAVMFAAATVLVAFGGPAHAKSLWEQISETAPRMEKPFGDLELSAPRSVFTDLQNTAPHDSPVFDDLAKTAP